MKNKNENTKPIEVEFYDIKNDLESYTIRKETGEVA